MNSTNRPTRFPELAYAQHAPSLWRIIATDTNQAVGGFYATKAELLADLERYAIDYGCANARTKSDVCMILLAYHDQALKDQLAWHTANNPGGLSEDQIAAFGSGSV